MYQNSKLYFLHDYIAKKAAKKLTDVHIGAANLFSQCLSDEALVIESSSKCRKMAFEEAAVMATNLKWANTMCILSFAHVLKVVLLALL